MSWDAIATFGSAALSFLGGESRNSAQMKMAQKQMDFQREMSNTAHRRQVKDLRKAGLNPILSAKYGGASSPPGSMAQIQDTITPAVNTGLQAMTTQANVDKIEAEIPKIQQEVKNLEAARDLTEEQTYKASQEIAHLRMQIAKTAAEANNISAQAVQEKILADYYESNEMALIAKDMGVHPAKYVELLEAYFEQLGTAISNTIDKFNPFN
jgi:hypothetical protein